LSINITRINILKDSLQGSNGPWFGYCKGIAEGHGGRMEAQI